MCKDTPKKEHKCCGGCKTNFNKEAPKGDQPANPVPPRRTCGTKPPKNG